MVVCKQSREMEYSFPHLVVTQLKSVLVLIFCIRGFFGGFIYLFVSFFTDVTTFILKSHKNTMGPYKEKETRYERINTVNVI